MEPQLSRMEMIEIMGGATNFTHVTTLLSSKIDSRIEDRELMYSNNGRIFYSKT